MRSVDFFATHPVFTRDDFVSARAQALSPRTADSLLARHVASGRLIRVRRGLYGSVPVGASALSYRLDPFLLATKLAPDATLGYHAALQFRGKSYSLWHRFPVLTESNLRPLHFQDSEFVRARPPSTLAKTPDLGGQIQAEPYAGGDVRVTSLERALVDVLDIPELGGGWEEIWRSLDMIEYLALDAVVAYTLRLASALTTARVGFHLQQNRERLFVEVRHLNPLREHAPKQARYLDSKRTTGRLVKPWNLVVPEYVLNRAWQEVA
jgi:predicted transcriptional regulator of viral defense system